MRGAGHGSDLRSLIPLLLCAGLPSQQLASAIAEAERLGARTGVVILDGDELRYAHRAGELFAPASNQKLLTAVACVHGLGIDHELTTAFALRDGELFVTAGGDPNWESGTEYDPARLLAPIVAALRDAGVQAVRGVQLDLSAYSGRSRPPDWPADQRELAYCAPTGGLAVDAGCFAATVRAPASGEAIIAEVAPAVFTLRGGIEVRAKGRAIWGLRDDGRSLVAYGAIRPGAGPTRMRAAVQDPSAVFQRVVERVLADGGVRIDPSAAPTTLALPPVCTPLRPALRRMLVDSSNFHAEQLARALGATARGDGSLAGGAAELRAQLARAGLVLDDACVVADASGLSRTNRTTPRLLAAALRHALAQPWGEELRLLLPAAGEEGTLRERFRDDDALAARVRAKTGWIAGASALSGYLAMPDGRQRIFSILMNFEPRARVTNRQLKELQERIVAAAAELDA
jgi:D-alanyl-D-alanine carboxypeptidase/D-alanyl-D-alanine-endopeptidase (penicillin-binding protein 4)